VKTRTGLLSKGSPAVSRMVSRTGSRFMPHRCNEEQLSRERFASDSA